MQLEILLFQLCQLVNVRTAYLYMEILWCNESEYLSCLRVLVQLK